MAKKKINKALSALIIVGLVFAGISGLHLLGAFSYLENTSYDWRVRFWANSAFNRPSDEIVVILLDQDSIEWAQRERDWGWPWPRQAYAEIIEFLTLSGAKSIAFDVLFSEPSIYRIAWDDDGYLVDAANESGRVVHAAMFSREVGSIFSWPEYLDVPLFQPQNFGSYLDRFKISPGMRGQFPIQRLRESAGAIGSVTGRPDPDGVIRRTQLFTIFDGKAIPSLSSASLLVAGHEPYVTFNSRNHTLEWGNFSIPVDRNGFALLRFKAYLDRYIPYNARGILQSAEALRNNDEAFMASPNFIRPENFVDTHIFFGFNAPGLYDIFASPMSAFYPGVGFHITMLDNLLQQTFIRESPEWLNFLILFAVIVFVVCFGVFFNRISISVTGMIAALAAVVAGSFAAYQFGGLWILMITYLASIIVSFVTVMLYNYATEGSQKRFIKSAFSQYLSPKVIEQIIQDPSQLKLGGEKRELTAIFTDVRAFSTISEALGDPTKLVELLNFYLTRMSNIVLENQGTIDKYEGDAIIAFFGAPIHLENHAVLACHSAVQMKKAEIEINREALTQGLVTPEVMNAMTEKKIISSVDDPCPLFTRIGMNTGDMVVGNMGTPDKMDYTIMGNAVNLAARLEGVNKQYDTNGILISEYTRAHIGNDFVLRPLNRVRVVGINTPLRLFELLDITEEALPDLADMIKTWEQAFSFYEKQDFLAAQNLFQTIAGKNIKIFGGEDKVVKKYLNRCEKFLTSPPDEKTWDNAVDNLTEK